MGWGFLAYLRRVLQAAWEHSFHAAHSIILVLIIAAGLLTYLVPQVEVMVDLHGWEVAAVVLGGVIAVRLLLAPYWIWKKDQEEIQLLQEKIGSAEVEAKRRAAKQAATDDLSEELSWAIHNLLNRNQGKEWTEEMVDPFESDMNEWCNKIKNKLGNREYFTRSDQLHFDRLGFVEPVGMSKLGRLNHLMSMLKMKFDRLRDVIGWAQGGSRP